jgi:hypothetical protein
MQTRSAVQSRDVSQLDNRVDSLIFNEEYATLSQAELKRLHDMALGLVQLLRPMLGLGPVMTGKQMRRERYG